MASLKKAIKKAAKKVEKVGKTAVRTYVAATVPGGAIAVAATTGLKEKKPAKATPQAAAQAVEPVASKAETNPGPSAAPVAAAAGGGNNNKMILLAGGGMLALALILAIARRK